MIGSINLSVYIPKRYNNQVINILRAIIINGNARQNQSLFSIHSNIHAIISSQILNIQPINKNPIITFIYLYLLKLGSGMVAQPLQKLISFFYHIYIISYKY